MNENPFRTPEPSFNHDRGDSTSAVELFSVMLWSNIGLVVGCLFFAGLNWLYVNWGTGDARDVSIAWSKLFFILIGANVIIFFTYTNGNTGQSVCHEMDD